MSSISAKHPFYESLLEQKEKGLLVPFEEFKPADLQRLWSEVTSGAIANLFGVNTKKVQRQLKKYGFNKWNTLIGPVMRKELGDQ